MGTNFRWREGRGSEDAPERLEPVLSLTGLGRARLAPVLHGSSHHQPEQRYIDLGCDPSVEFCVETWVCQFGTVTSH
jgi:hypothetical protein